ncbi:hypothetical protein Hdeb2414_s0028g00701031 [Helianthus debilis subsp. tardiflorus]
MRIKVRKDVSTLENFQEILGLLVSNSENPSTPSTSYLESWEEVNLLGSHSKQWDQFELKVI